MKRSGVFVIVFLLVIGLALAAFGAPVNGNGASPDALMQQGAQAFQRGGFEQALTSWKHAAELYSRDKKIKEQSQALAQAAHAAQALGQVKQALPTLELALALAQQTGDRAWVIMVLDALGRAYLANQQMDAASHYMNQALELAASEKDPGLTAPILNDVGILKAAQQQYADALAAFSESLTLAEGPGQRREGVFTESAAGAEGAGQRSMAVRARINAARAAGRLGRPQDAKEWLDKALEQLRAFEPSHEKAVGLITVGLAYAELRASLPGQSEPLLVQAAGILTDAASVAERIGDARAASYAYGYLGHLYETEHRYDEALILTRQAVFAAQSATAPESLYRWQWQTGRVLAALGRLDEALTAYRSATITLQPIRPEVALAAQGSTLSGQESVRPLYFEFADLLLKRAALMDEGEAAQGYLKAARDAVEASKAQELRDYFRDECVDALQAHITTLDSVSKTTAVIYPVVFPDRTELLVSLPTGLKRVSVEVSATQLTQEVRTFRRRLEDRTSREYLPHAQKFYDWLIRPLETDLGVSKIDTLVFVPDGPLRSIPMAALHDGKQFLIARYAIATTPGLNLTDPRPINRERVKILSSGLTESVQGFPPLPHVALELRAIQALFGGDQLVNQAFVVSGLEKELKEKPFSVLHIASHGRFEKDVGRSFILAYDDKLTMAKLDQYVGLYKFRQEPLELLTLSACETAVGDDRAALGLAGVAIKAGARSALATLWSINDDASSGLVAEFYRQLHDPAVSKAVALQRAQLKMLADNGYDHPAYWSPFLLLNNWL